MKKLNFKLRRLNAFFFLSGEHNKLLYNIGGSQNGIKTYTGYNYSSMAGIYNRYYGIRRVTCNRYFGHIR